MDRIVAELKQILKKDFNRRMVEGTAFKGKCYIRFSVFIFLFSRELIVVSLFYSIRKLVG